MLHIKSFRLPLPTVNRESVRHARQVFHAMPGVAPTADLLTAIDGSAKALHSLDKGDLVVMLYLAPHTMSGVINMCPYSTPTCRRGCLVTAGRAAFYPHINEARINRTKFMVEHPYEFAVLLTHEVGLKFKRYGDKLGMRLNGTSDAAWEVVAPWMFDLFPQVTFYDYTKWPVDKRPGTYDLTRSVSERPVKLTNDQRWAVVFNRAPGDALPATYEGLPVIDGDVTDARHKEPVGVVVGLRAKGDMIGDQTGMVKA